MLNFNLSNTFLNKIKKLFKNKEIDETEYLNKSENNRKRLLEEIENVKNNKNLVEVNF